MSRIARSCFQSVLKVANSGIGMVGIALIVYAVWMFMVWKRHLGPDSAPNASIPWFIYTIIGLGATLCVITCFGHIAAETANGCCLFIYMVFIFMLLVLEAAVTADVLLNRNWEEDFPDDPTENLDKLKDFIKDNFDICKWIGLAIVGLQGLIILLAMILKALGPHSVTYYESDDDYIPDRVPLLKNYVPSPSCVVNDPLYQPKNDSWNIKINSKAGRSFR